MQATRPSLERPIRELPKRTIWTTAFIVVAVLGSVAGWMSPPVHVSHVESVLRRTAATAATAPKPNAVVATRSTSAAKSQVLAAAKRPPRPSLPAQTLPAALSNFVVQCGTSLCLRGVPFVIKGATGYGTYDDPDGEIQLAQAGNINTIELSEFDTQYHVLSDAMSEATWTRVDRFIAASAQAHMHVILNLSEYGQSLQAAGQIPETVDWGPYLAFIANRTNSVTGVPYKDDPTIAMVELFGEICYPGETDSSCPAGTSGTAEQMAEFFHRSLDEWHAAAPNILVSSGGFSHLNGSTTIPWQQIMADPLNSTCDMEINSPNDVSDSVAKVTSLCQSIGKPWFLAAWSSCYDSTSYPFFTATDNDMAAHAGDMYSLAAGGDPAAYPAVGSSFWNLQDTGTSTGTCNLSPSFPATWATIQHG
jgi:hypothetical protein